jgi:hypothetical protein
MKIILVTSQDIPEGTVGYSSIEVKDYKGVADEKALSIGFVFDCFRKIMGKTLTIIDASILDKQQNKSVKDLVRNMFSENMEFVSEMVYDQKKLQDLIPDDLEAIGEPIAIEDILGVK